MIGRKNDNGKRQWHLLPIEPINEIIKVLEFGAKKYEPDNWKFVENRKIRYFNAAMRHLTLWQQGYINDGDESGNEKEELIEKMDKSGLNHLAHAACCLLFLLHGDMNKERVKINKD